MTLPTLKWQILQQTADRLRQGALHEQAIELYTQALAQPGVPWEAYCAMTLARATCHVMLGETIPLDEELSALVEQASRRNDDAVLATALTELAEGGSGDLERTLRL